MDKDYKVTGVFSGGQIGKLITWLFAADNRIIQGS